MRDNHRQRIFMLRTNVDEMNVEPIDLSDEVRYGPQFCLALAPVVICSPIEREFLHRRELHPLRRVGDLFAVRPLCRVDAPPQIRKISVWKIELKRTNGSLVCLWLSSAGMRHGVLHLFSFGFQSCQSFRDLPGAESGCQAEHRTRLEKSTS